MANNKWVKIGILPDTTPIAFGIMLAPWYLMANWRWGKTRYIPGPIEISDAISKLASFKHGSPESGGIRITNQNEVWINRLLHAKGTAPHKWRT